MADPKFANLPGIAYDQPDVYETDDLPEADQADLVYEDKQLISDRVDFSDKLKKGPNRGYDTRSGGWELAGAGEEETPIQKFQRLKCELTELEEEVSKLKDSVKPDAKGDGPGIKDSEAINFAKMSVEIQNAQKHLSNLRLEDLLGTDIISSLQDPQGTQLKRLMLHLEEFQKKGPSKSEKKPESAKSSDAQPGVITYQLCHRPEQTKLSQATRLTELEQRLHKLEAALGTTPDYLKRLASETHEKSLLEAVHSLGAKFALLEPSHVEHMDALLSSLGVKMDNLSEKAAVKGQTDLDRDKKISDLYEIVAKTEPVSQFLPQTIERLIALECLHRQAGDFATALSQLEAVQTQIANNLQENKTALQDAQKAFTENIDTIKGNISNLERRIGALSSKK